MLAATSRHSMTTRCTCPDMAAGVSAPTSPECSRRQPPAPRAAQHNNANRLHDSEASAAGLLPILSSQKCCSYSSKSHAPDIFRACCCAHKMSVGSAADGTGGRHKYLLLEKPANRQPASHHCDCSHSWLAAAATMTTAKSRMAMMTIALSLTGRTAATTAAGAHCIK